MIGICSVTPEDPCFVTCMRLQHHEYYELNLELSPKLSNSAELNLLFDSESFDSRQKS